MKTHRVPFLPVLVIMGVIGALVGWALKDEDPAWLFIALLCVGIACALTLDQIERR